MDQSTLDVRLVCNSNGDLNKELMQSVIRMDLSAIEQYNTELVSNSDATANPKLQKLSMKFWFHKE